MTEKKKSVDGNEVAQAQNETKEVQVSLNDMMTVFDKPGQMKDYTSELVKLEPGEVLKGIMERETETLEGEDGEYTAVRIHRIEQGLDEEPNISTVLMSGGVIVSAHEKIFGAHPDKTKVPVYIVGRGQIKSKAGRNYTSYTVKSI